LRSAFASGVALGSIGATANAALINSAMINPVIAGRDLLDIFFTKPSFFKVYGIIFNYHEQHTYS
jgi:hypothetical protein